MEVLWVAIKRLNGTRNSTGGAKDAKNGSSSALRKPRQKPRNHKLDDGGKRLTHKE